MVKHMRECRFIRRVQLTTAFAKCGLVGVTRPAEEGEVALLTGGEIPTSRSLAVDSDEAIAHLAGELIKNE